MKFFSVLLLILFFSASLFAGQWHQLAKNPGDTAIKSIDSESTSSLTLDVDVPGYETDTVNVSGRDYNTIFLKGSSPTLIKGAPELRKITMFVAIPSKGTVKAEIVSADTTIKDCLPILPSKGSITRNINPDTVSYQFSNIYSQANWYPAEQDLIKVSKPFMLNKVRGVRLTVTPFRYHPMNQKLMIYKNIQVKLTSNAPERITLDSSSTIYNKLYRDVFINLKNKPMPTAPEVKKNLLIVVYDDFYDAVLPLKEWKTKLGFKTDIVKMSTIGSTGEQLKAYLQNIYDQGNLNFVILVGDANQIPYLRGKFESAASDNCLVKLSGDDNVPDAFISRISVENAKDAEYIVMKSIYYEQYPSVGNDGKWYKQTLGIASSQGNPSDKERIDAITANMTNAGYTKVYKCYDTGYYGGADKNIIFNATADGVGIIEYCGHGSEYQWVSSGFSTSDVKKLNNGFKLPVIWSVACVNGSFVGKTCFAEAWLRQGNKDATAGCIGMAAATTNMAWVPPCVWQEQIINEETCKHLHNIASVQNVYGILKCMEVYGTDDKSQGNMLNEQIIYFGDGTVTLRTEAAKQIDVSQNRTKNGIVLSVSDEGTKTPLSDCTVSVYDYNGNNMSAYTTDENGNVTIKNKDAKLYTISGNNVVPVVDAEL